MALFSEPGSTGKQVIIPLRCHSHEVCVAVTQIPYWQQLTQDSSISITSSGNYVPYELESICSEHDEPRLQLVVKSQHERDNKHFDTVCTRIHYDLISFENNDRPVYDPDSQHIIVCGSLYNSLPATIFDTPRYLLGQRNCNIKRIRNALACSILIDETVPHRIRFTIHHQHHTIMDLAVIQIQALVKQTQYQYLMAFALKLGQRLIGPIERMETHNDLSTADSKDFPAFTAFQPNIKRKRDNDEEEQHQQQHTPNATGSATVDSEQSDDDETIPDERREQRREQIENLLTRICDRMRARTPRDPITKGREDSSQIKSYFRNTNASKSGSNDSDAIIELVEHEMDLRTRGINEHKCTLVFNKQLKIGVGVRDRIKKTAKMRAYENFKTITRETSRDTLTVKQTRDGLWKTVVKPMDH